MIALRTSDLKADFSNYFKKAFEGEKIVVTRPKRQNVVIISEERMKELERIEQNALYLAKLERGIEQIKQGKTVERELIEV